MDLTNRRAVLVAVLACAAIGAAALPPAGAYLGWKDYSRSIFRRARSERLRYQIGDLSNRREMIAIKDTLVRRAASLESGEMRLHLPPDTPGELRDQLQSAFARARVQIGSKVIVPVLVTLMLEGKPESGQTGQSYGRSVKLDHLPPDRMDGRTCHVLIRVARSYPPGRVMARLMSRSSLMGPCGFIAAFGEPGPAVHRWLRSRHYDVARGAGFPANPAAQAGSIAGTADRDSVILMYARYELGATRGCRAGDLAACRKAVLAPQLTYTSPFGHRRFEQPAGEASAFFLSDLVLEFGRERFQKFWTSSAEPEVAFEQAFGLPLDTWTNRWMRYRYDPETRGPFIPASSVLTALLAVAALMTVAVAMERRQVG